MTDPILIRAFVVAILAAVAGAGLLRGIIRGRQLSNICPDCGHVQGDNHEHCQACADEKNDMAAGV